MSRQSSPGPTVAGQQTSYYRDQHGLPIEKPGPQIKIVYRGGEQAQDQRQSAQTPVPAATSSSSGRTKSRAYQSGIAAGAEDVKYAAKYRDLKQKVREIEGDNDRLVFKVLQAKRNIQRAKLERAILYERLGAFPATPPPPGNVPLPPPHAVQQQVPPGGPVPRHPADATQYGQSSRHQRSGGLPPPAPHHHHRQHHQQPIQPAPAPSQVSPPQHHAQAHGGHHPPRDTAHPGQLPITHAQQVTQIQTQDGPLLVVAGPDGRPVTTTDGHYIPAQDIHHAPPPSSGSHPRKRGGRVSKEVREMREREAREMREREEMERKQQAMLAGGANNSGNGRVSSPRPAPGGPQNVSMSRERERDWEIEREIREQERMQRRDGHENDRERTDRHRDGHGHHHSHHHHTHGHGHGHHHRQQGSPPPPSADQEHSPDRAPSPPPPPPPLHRTHSQTSHTSHASYRSHHSHHSHHIHSHSHSHSGSPHSPGGSNYPATRIHNHQRIGPGSYVLRDRGPPAEESGAATPTPVSATASGPATAITSPQNEEPPANVLNASANAPGGAASSSSRVPTPPYMHRSAFNNSQASPTAGGAGEDAAAKSEAGAPNPSEDGSGAQSLAATPP